MEFKGGMVRHDTGEAGRDGFILVLCVIFRHLKIELLWRSSLHLGICPDKTVIEKDVLIVALFTIAH